MAALEAANENGKAQSNKSNRIDSNKNRNNYTQGDIRPSMFSLSKVSIGRTKVADTATNTTITSTSPVATAMSDTRKPSTASFLNRQPLNLHRKPQAYKNDTISITSFTNCHDNNNDDGDDDDDDDDDVMARVDRALMLDGGDDDQRGTKNDASNNNIITVPITKKSNTTILNFHVKSNLDEDDTDDDLLSMAPVFARKKVSSTSALSSSSTQRLEKIGTAHRRYSSTHDNSEKVDPRHAESSPSKPDHGYSVECNGGKSISKFDNPLISTTSSSSQPTLEEIFAAMDALFAQSDLTATTLEAIFRQLESTFGLPLRCEHKTRIKERLVNHLSSVANADIAAAAAVVALSGSTNTPQSSPSAARSTNNEGNATTTITKKRHFFVSLEMHDDTHHNSCDQDGDTLNNICQITSKDTKGGQCRDAQLQQQPQQPALDALYAAIAYLHGISDSSTMTKDVVEALETAAFFGVRLSHDHKTLINQRWNLLIQTSKQKATLEAKQTEAATEAVPADEKQLPANHSIHIQQSPLSISNVTREALCPSQHRPRRVLSVIHEKNPSDSLTISTSNDDSRCITKRGDGNKVATLDQFNLCTGKLIQEDSGSKTVDLTKFTDTWKATTATSGSVEAPTAVMIRNDRKRKRLRKPANVEPIKQSIPANNAKKRPATRSKVASSSSRKRQCGLCSTCPCTKTEDTAAKEFGFQMMPRTEFDVEKALLRRWAKLDRTTESCQQQKEAVKREIKKIRRKIWKRQVDRLGLDQKKIRPFGDSHFLPDAEEWDEQIHDRVATAQIPLMPPTAVTKAKRKLFADPQAQPTLTQMLGQKVELRQFICDPTETCEVVNHAEALVRQDGIESLAEEMRRDVDDDDDDARDEDFMETNEEGEEEANLNEATDRVHRIAWKSGSRLPEMSSPLLRGMGVWSAITFACRERGLANIEGDPYACSWDRLFDDLDVDDGIDELVEIFDANAPTTLDEVISSSSSPSEMADKSLLSQRGQNLVAEIETAIEKDKEKQSAVESLCSNWKENVAFAFARTDDAEVLDALEKVKESKDRLHRIKAKVLEECSKRQALLELYESSLEMALERLREKSKVTVIELEGSEPSSPESKPHTPNRSVSTCRLNCEYDTEPQHLVRSQ